MANKAYDYMHYGNASVLYEEILRKNPNDQELILKLATCYLKMNNMIKAEEIYWRAYKNNGSSDTIILQKLAHVLEENGKYAASEEIAGKCYRLSKRKENKILQTHNLGSFYKDTAYIKLYGFKYNTQFADFSPAAFGKGLVFCSSRTEDPSEGDNFGFVDLYFSDTVGTMAFLTNQKSNINKASRKYLRNTMAIPFDKRINTKYHEGPCTFVGDTVIYFTRNSFDGLITHKSKDHATNLDIFVSSFKKGTWTKPEILSFCDKNYSEGHPTISKDGNTLYFVSNMPGGLGETDIYMVKRENGKWTKPENMGEKINTENDDLFPFISNDNVLYFASKGHFGMGGLDIYKFDLEKENAQAINMGYPINSKDDDFGLIINKEGKNGFISSNRKHRGVDDDIYYFTIKDKVKPTIRVHVKNMSDSIILKNANVVAIAETGTKSINQTIKSHQDSLFIYTLQMDNDKSSSYNLISSSNGYLTDTLLIQPSEWLGKGDFIDTTVYLLKSIEVMYRGNVLDNKTGKPIQNATLYLLNLKTQLFDSMQTDVNGRFTKPLESNTNYMINVSKENYFSQCIKVLPSTNEISFNLIKKEIHATFKVNNLFYDYNSINLKPESINILNNLVDNLLLTSPDIKIEIGSHTDSKGDDNYNKKLSQRRADSVATYMIKRGFSSAQISAKGYGETVLLNQCKNGSICTEEQHSINRRTEIKIIGFINKKASNLNNLERFYAQCLKD